MTEMSLTELKALGRIAAEGLAGPQAVEDIDVTFGEDSLERPAYFFSFLIDKRDPNQQRGLFYIRLIQRVRDALIARGDFIYPIIRILNREEWNKRAVA